MSKVTHIMKIMRHNFQLKSINPLKHWQFTIDNCCRESKKISFEQYEKNTNDILFQITKNKILSSQIHDDDYYTITQNDLLGIKINSNMKNKKDLLYLTDRNKFNVIGYEFINGQFYSFVNEHYNEMFCKHVLRANKKYNMINNCLPNIENHIKHFDFVLECDELNDAMPINKLSCYDEYHSFNIDHVLINKIKAEIMCEYKNKFSQ